MSSTNDSNHDPGGQDAPAETGEQEHAGSSGEGAASALAHFKTQARQHRRLYGNHEESAREHSQ